MKFLNVKKDYNLSLIFIFLLISLIITACNSRKIITDSSKSKQTKVSGNLLNRYSLLLGVPKRELSNVTLYRFIDNWIGVPHQIGGMNKNGVDCSGFATILEKEIYNQPLPRVARQMAEEVKRKYKEDLQEGDLVFFDFDGQKFSHVGVYLHNNKFVHASTSRGVIISDLTDPWYNKYFSRAGSIRTLNN